MLPLSILGLAFYTLVLVGAFALRSAAGFGAVLIAVPMLAFILPVTTAVSVATALSVLTSMQQVNRDWRHIAWKQFLLISLYSLIGIGLGFYFLHALDEDALRRGLGGFLILYSLYVFWTGGASPAFPTRWHAMLGAAAGTTAGFFSVLFGGGVGPIYVVYFNIVGMSREAFRVTMSTILLVGTSIRIAGYASFGFYGSTALMLLAIGLPLVFIGSWLGDRLAQHLNPKRFQALVGGLVLVAGVALLIK